MKLKKIISILLFVCMIFSFTACNNANNNDVQNEQNSNVGKVENSIYPYTFTDDSGVEVVLEKAPEKLVSGSPSITEVIYAVDKQDSLVGVTDNCNYPEDALNKEKIGVYGSPNLEKIIDLGADMFICNYLDDNSKKTLEDAGVKVVILESKDYKDTFTKIELIGNAIGAITETNQLLNSMREKEEFILTKLEGAETKTVFNEVWHDPLMTSGPGSFMDEMITTCKGENVAGDADTAYPQYSVELLIEKNPQVYITADDGFKTIDDIKARTGFDQIDAIKNNQIYMLNPDIISRPGPRVVDALEIVAKAIHPELFN